MYAVSIVCKYAYYVTIRYFQRPICATHAFKIIIIILIIMFSSSIYHDGTLAWVRTFEFMLPATPRADTHLLYDIPTTRWCC